MSVGLIGRKCGMTRIFAEDGEAIPVTVVEVSLNRVVQVKDTAKDGYSAIQITSGISNASHITRALAGHFSRAAVTAGRFLHEFRLSADEQNKFTVGDELTVSLFDQGQLVDVKGISKGKGFQGVVKRHNFSMQDATHGNSVSHRAPGSIGQRQSPGRVFKGKKMAGHMGNKRCTVQNQKLIRIDFERCLLLIRGVVPGAPGGQVIVMPAIKKFNDKGV